MFSATMKSINARRLLAALIVACLAIAGVSVAASAETVGKSDTGFMTVRRIDAETPKEISATIELQGITTTADELRNGGLKIFEGEKTSQLASPNLQVTDAPKFYEESGVVLLADTSQLMDVAGRFEAMKSGLKSIVANLPSGTRVALVTFGGPAAEVEPLTSDLAKISAAIDQLRPAGRAYEASGLSKAASILEDAGVHDGDVVWVSGGNADSSVESKLPEAITQLQLRRARLFAYGIAGSDEYSRNGKPRIVDTLAKVGASKDSAIVTSFTESSEANVIADPNSASSLAGLGLKLQRRNFDIKWSSPTNSAAVVESHKAFLIGLSYGDTIGFPMVINGGRSIERPVVSDRLPEPKKILGLSQRTTQILGMALGGLGLSLAVLVGLMLLRRDEIDITQRLSSANQFAMDAGDEISEGPRSYADTAFVKAAVERTTQFAGDKGLLQRVESRLEQADLNLRAGELIFFNLVLAVLLTGAGFVVGGLLLAIFGAALGVFVPITILNVKAEKRLKAFNSKLPDTLHLLSSSLRAGYSVMQAIDAVSHEVGDPMGVELRRAVTEAQLGRPVNEALLEVAQRMKSPDFEWAVMAINIQREVGGNLSELLDTVADTMLERERLRREVKSLTAEGRASAYILTAMPPVLLVVMYGMNKDYASLLITRGEGNVMLGLGVFSMVVGFFWMQKTVTIKL